MIAHALTAQRIWPSSPTVVVKARLSAAKVPAAVDYDALAGDEAGLFGGEEAHGMGDVAGNSHPPGGHRCQVSIHNVGWDAGVPLDRDEAGCDGVHSDARGGEFAGPGTGQAYLCALGGGIGGPVRRRTVSDLGVDVHDAAIVPGHHRGEHRAAEQHGALDEEVQL